MSRKNRKPTTAINQTPRSPSRALRFIVSGVLVVSLLVLIGFLLSPFFDKHVGAEDMNAVMQARAKATEKHPDFAATRFRLFPQDGYRHFASAKDVPWEKVLNSDNPWTDEESTVISVAATLILPAMGKDDPSFQTLPTEENRGKGCIVKKIAPLDDPISIGDNGRIEFIDSIWVPETQTIFLSRRMVGTSLILTASQLYQNCRRAVATPDFKTALERNPATVSAEVFSDLDRFHAGLRKFLESNKTEEQARQLFELSVIEHNLITHQRTGEGFMKLDRPKK